LSLVEYEVKGRIAYIAMNRPEKLNAMNREMLDGLWDAFARLRDDQEVWLGIVTGRGRSFSVGHDLVEMSSGGSAVRGPRSTDELYFMEQHIWKPVIAAVNGHCLAQGAGIALGADIRVAADTAKFGWPQTKRGISSISGPVILSQRIPLCRAMELLFTGEFMEADEALKLGLVNHVVPEQQLMSKAEEIAETILQNAPLAVGAMKEAAVRGLHLSVHDRLNMAGMIFEQVRDTSDAQEGLDAFHEKRAPVWTGA
jgi:E-phenylitaconyl-CoA hydratase